MYQNGGGCEWAAVAVESGIVERAYPILLDVSRRPVVIIGGGRVAARKARGVIEAGARVVRVVSPEIGPEMPDSVERIKESYRPEHLHGAGAVFAATDNSEVNRAIVEDAHRLGLLVNRADSDENEPGDFTVPALLREGELLVTVSTGGSPALAATIRDALRERLDPNWALMATAMKELRPRILDSGWPIEKRREAFRLLASVEAIAMLERDGIDGLWAWMIGMIVR